MLFPALRPARRTAHRRGYLSCAAAVTACVLIAPQFAPAAAQSAHSPGTGTPPAASSSGPTGSIAPASIPAALSSANPLDELGRPRPELLEQARQFAHQPWVPPEVRDILLSAVAFFAGTGETGVDLPDNAPEFTQFYWPTVAGRCIGGELDSVGSALAVRGPSEIPAPGAAAGETTFLFTALGTAPAAADQGEMAVDWVNLYSLQFGHTPLRNHGINPEGPATISGTAATGTSPVAAVLRGTVHTGDGPCTFQPTAAFLPARHEG